MTKAKHTVGTAEVRALDHGQAANEVEATDPYVLRGSASTTVEKIALKHGDAFMVTDARGDLPASEQETGLFWHGTRFLRSCDLFLEGLPLVTLSHSISDEEGSCQVDLTNPFLPLAQEAGVYQGMIHVGRLLELQGHQLAETLLVTSFEPEPVELTLGLKTGADFRDIFEVRGLRRVERGEVEEPQIERDHMLFSYHGRDNIERRTRVMLDPPAERVVNDAVFWRLRLQRGETQRIQIRVAVSEEAAADHGARRSINMSETVPPDFAQPNVVISDNVFFNRVLSRGTHDLVMLSTMTPEGLYPYGGVPWYVCPFGRDALITSQEFVPWFPEVARGTLAFLAAHQGTKFDEFTEEEPGRILHEYRRGEMANCREIPFIPYYGTIDANPLFLITLESYIRWTDDLELLQRLWPNAEAAATWMREYGDRDHDTFLEYARVSDKGLVNQGWKDSWDSVSYADGRLAEAPISLCEVQGYAYAAYLAMSYLATRLGKLEEAARWRRAAEALQDNFVRHFWWEREDVCYLALDGQKEPCDVVSSNAGQCLWTGILPEELAQRMIDRLQREDMYTEWGIRTLSAAAARYNPMSYHNGSVWPHDTALVGAGFARYGRKADAGRLLGNLFGVSLFYEGARLPELFCGFSRRRGYAPTRYPVACSPQSWAAGAPFLLLSALLGFEPEAERQRLMLRRPVLPDWLEELELQDLRLGQQRAHLRIVRSGDDTAVKLTEDMGIDVHVLPR
jgi:glycogen debranching enzyme